MNSRLFLYAVVGNALLTLFLGVGLLVVLLRPASVAPTPVDNPLAGTFTGPHAVADAQWCASYFESLAQVLDDDGRTSTPVVTTKQEVQRLIERSAPLTNFYLQGTHPDLGPAAASRFRTWSVAPGPLSAAERAAAVEILRQLSTDCRRAAR